MNYFIIKNIVETTLTHFACKECGAKATEQNIHILGTAGNSLNMEVICSQCQASGVIKAEMNIMGINTSPAQLAEQLKKTVGDKRKEEAIKDADILKFREDIQKTSSVSDLFNS
jgi:pyrimidine operon attenuation protein/uracil phosphoribosyltransferase